MVRSQDVADTADSTLMKYTSQAIAVGKGHGAVSSIFAMYVTYLINADIS